MAAIEEGNRIVKAANGGIRALELEIQDRMVVETVAKKNRVDL